MVPLEDHKRAIVNFYDTESGYFKSKEPVVIVCNRFSREYEDAILYKCVENWNPHFVLVTTRANSVKELGDENVICAKTSNEQTWEQQTEAIAGAIKKSIHDKKSVIVFPSRRIRDYSFDRIAWDKCILRCIYELKVPVVTVCIKSIASDTDSGWTSIFRNLRIAFYPKREFNLQLRAGKPLTAGELENFKQAKALRRYLFTKTHALGTSTQLDKFYTKQVSGFKVEVAAEAPPPVLMKEIEAIEKYKVAQKGSMAVYICPALIIPNIMKQLGVLREITYREAGEGTGKAIDIDEFDLYYKQIFIWDSKKEKIVGGYRMGCGDEIMYAYGRSGFYLNTLFKLKKELEPVLNHSLEMGRSFVVKEYQKDAFPLFLLWKAIFIFLNREKHYQYLLGPVSLSSDYSHFSRKLIVAFLERHFFDKKMAKLVVARNPFKEKLEVRSKRVLLQQFNGVLNNLDKFIEEIEPSHFRLPVLIKQYIKQNSRFIGFNVDPLFNNAIDCLIVLDIKKLPDSTAQNLS